MCTLNKYKAKAKPKRRTRMRDDFHLRNYRTQARDVKQCACLQGRLNNFV